MPARIPIARSHRAASAAAAAVLLGAALLGGADVANAEGGDGRPSPFSTPPPGGLTIGIAGASSLEALVAAQPFEVASVATFDVRSQRLLLHVVDGPADANTLAPGALDPGAVVLIRRAGVLVREEAAPTVAGSSTGPGVAVAFTAPPPGGITAGAAQVSDLDALIEAQTFRVRSVSTWDVSNQRWLTYVPGAPAALNTLTDEHLSPGLPVFLRRAGRTAPSGAGADLVEGERKEERVTYYYCARGTLVSGWGDGGGFCGHMRNGEVVHSGAAACAFRLLGTRFRIEGDPTGRVYTCKDTGSGVHGGHRDIWFNSSDEGVRWAAQIGPRATVITLH